MTIDCSTFLVFNPDSIHSGMLGAGHPKWALLSRVQTKCSGYRGWIVAKMELSSGDLSRLCRCWSRDACHRCASPYTTLPSWSFHYRPLHLSQLPPFHYLSLFTVEKQDPRFTVIGGYVEQTWLLSQSRNQGIQQCFIWQSIPVFFLYIWQTVLSM